MGGTEVCLREQLLLRSAAARGRGRLPHEGPQSQGMHPGPPPHRHSSSSAPHSPPCPWGEGERLCHLPPGSRPHLDLLTHFHFLEPPLPPPLPHFSSPPVHTVLLLLSAGNSPLLPSPCRDLEGPDQAESPVPRSPGSVTASHPVVAFAMITFAPPLQESRHLTCPRGAWHLGSACSANACHGCARSKRPPALHPETPTVKILADPSCSDTPGVFLAP